MRFALLSVALLLATPAQANIINDEEAYSPVERELDVAIENLINAQTYICPDLAGSPGATLPRRQYDALDRRYFEVVVGARQMLGRSLNIRVWTNACRTRNPGRQFREHMRSAERAIAAAERMISDWGKT